MNQFDMDHDLIQSMGQVLPKSRLDESREPPEDLVEQLAESHPVIRLAWEPALQRWAMYEKVGGLFMLTAALTGPGGAYVNPTYGNTIGYLEQHSMRAMANKWDLQRWLNKIDEGQQKGAAEIRKSHEPQIREGSNDLYNVLIDRKVVGSNGKAPDVSAGSK